MALYLVHSLSRQHPEYNIEYLVDEECKLLVQNHPQIQRVHVIRRSEIQNQAETGDYLRAYSLLRQSIKDILGTDYLMSLNLFQENYTAIIQTLVRAQVKRGKALSSYCEYRIPDSWSKYLYSIPANRSANVLHAIDVYHRIAGLDSYPRPEIKLPFCMPKDAIFVELEKKIRYIAIQPGSAWSGKKWPLLYWKEFIKQFLYNSDEHIVIAGAPQEYDEAAELTQINPQRIINLVGKTDILETSHIFKNASLLLTGDTFAMHMATAVTCPVFALFGPSNPIETGPYGLHHIIIQAQANTLSDFDLSNQQHSAMQALNPKQVIAILFQKEISHTLVSETFWNAKQSYQFVVDVQTGRHTLRQELSKVPDIETVPKENVIQLLYSILQTLSIFKQTTPSAQDTAHLSNLDAQLADITHNTIAFEYYRISINSIPISSLELYLDQRTALTQEYIELLK